MEYSCTLLEIPLLFLIDPLNFHMFFLQYPWKFHVLDALIGVFLEWPIFWNSNQKPTQKQPEMTVSAGSKKYENSELENYRSKINKTCLVSAPT